MKNIEPSEFKYLGVWFQHIGWDTNMHGEKEEIIAEEYDYITEEISKNDYKWSDIYLNMFDEGPSQVGEWYNCPICGHKMHNGSAYVHIPTNKVHIIGNDCSLKLNMMDKNVFEYKKRMAKINSTFRFMCEKLGLEESLFSRNNNILNDLKNNMIKYKNLSDKQVELVHKINKQLDNWEKKQEEDKKREEEIAHLKKPAVIGKNILVEGKIMATKWKHSDYYGSVHKMLIETKDYWKLWVSVPKKLEDAGNEIWENIKGMNIKLKCEVSIMDDEFFAFGKRPKLIEIGD